MKFDFSDEAKEKYYKKAEERLKAAGVDFLKVDRTGIGVRNFDPDRMEAKMVIVDLHQYPYANFSARKWGKCNQIEGWHKTNDRIKRRKGTTEKEIYMRSRIEFPDNRGRRKHD